MSKIKRSDIENMPAGKEINDLVAEHVMGWHKGIYVSEIQGRTFQSSSEDWLDADGRFMYGIAPDDGRYEDSEDFHLLHWHPSESILWAWEVVEKMRAMGFQVEISIDSSGRTWVAFLRTERGSLETFESGAGDTTELAIDRAALLTVMEFED